MMANEQQRQFTDDTALLLEVGTRLRGRDTQRSL